MPKNLRLLRRKIRTTENIWQITRAMSMVSAVQLRRVQQSVESRSEYFRRLSAMLERVSASSTPVTHAYLAQPVQQRRIGLVIAAGDRGLCGSYNTNILRAADDFIRRAGCRIDVIAVGAKAVLHARRRAYPLLEAYGSLRDCGDPTQAAQISRQIRRIFDDTDIDAMHVAYTRFASAARHVPTVTQLLPVLREHTEETVAVEYILEPDPQQLIDNLLPMAVEAELGYYLLQSLASEHAARMIAMTASSDNADEMKNRLVKQLNQARQQKITNEVLEVINGSDALSSG